MLKELLRRPIAFHPVLARAFGGIQEALFWQQIYYWSDKGKLADGWVYKSKKELEEETTLTRFQQDRVRANLEQLGVLETRVEKIKNVPTVHYRVNVEEVEKRVSRLSGNLLGGKQETYVGVGKKLTFPLYTESTQRVPTCETAVSRVGMSVSDVAARPPERSDPTRSNVVAEVKEFDLDAELQTMLTGEKYRKVIAIFLIEKRKRYGVPNIEDHNHLNLTISRHVVAARLVAKSITNVDTLLRALHKAFDKCGEETTIETIIKYLTK